MSAEKGGIPAGTHPAAAPAAPGRLVKVATILGSLLRDLFRFWYISTGSETDWQRCLVQTAAGRLWLPHQQRRPFGSMDSCSLMIGR